MTRGGRKKTDEGPERRCIVTRTGTDKATLIRFVVGPEGQVVGDITGKLPGRGMWVSAQRDVLKQAMAKGMFARAAKTKVKVPADLAEQVECALVARVIELLSLARKAGQAVAGYEKAKSWLESGRAGVLVQARDGSDRGKSKLRPPAGKDSFISCLDAGEMGLAFGRESVIHGALATGGLATRVVEEASRLSSFRVEDGGIATGKGTKDA